MIKGIGRASSIKKRTRAYIRPWFDSQIAIRADVYIVDELPSALIEADIPKGLILADLDFAIPAPIQTLIGADIWPRVVGTTLYRHHQGAVIQDSEFGYCILGRFVLKRGSTLYHSILTATKEPARNEEELDKLLRSFWEVKTQVEAIKTIRSPQEDAAEKIFLESHYRERDGRYVVEIPIKEDAFPLPDSRGIALRRFYQLDRRLSRDPEWRAKYVELMREFKNLGHMRLAVGESKPGRFNYIPHHCVCRKFRVVLDGSAYVKGGKSFNDVQLVGEKLQFDILDQIMRVRRHKIAFVADMRRCSGRLW